MQEFWNFLIRERRLVRFIDFENKKRIFHAVHPEQKFALVSITGSAQSKEARATVGSGCEVTELVIKRKVYDFDMTTWSDSARILGSLSLHGVAPI